jgi:uncharacterized membrane protein (UPF0127 family)
MGTNERKRRSLIRQVIFVVLLILALGGLFARYLWQRSEAAILRAHFILPNGNKSPELLLRVADTDAKRRKGLMYVRELPEKHGMLFVYPEEDQHEFWMKNTLLSLDMIFIGGDFKVVGVLKNVPVMDETRRGVGKPSRYVVEIPAGGSDRFGIVDGSEFKPVAPLPPAR